MNYILAFLFAGLLCLLGQIIIDNTKLTPGHVTTLFSVLGVVLSFLGIYEKFINIFGAGATVLISNFGHLLYQGGLEGFFDEGIIGIFTGMLTKSSAALTGAIVFSFIFLIVFRSKN